MRLVVVESPYGRNPDGSIADAATVERNLRYLRACLADCLRRGESPIASHGLLTQPGVLDDSVPAERERGLAAGWAWHVKAAAVVFYVDLGITEGMERAKRHTIFVGAAWEQRRLGGVWASRDAQESP